MMPSIILGTNKGFSTYALAFSKDVSKLSLHLSYKDYGTHYLVPLNSILAFKQLRGGLVQACLASEMKPYQEPSGHSEKCKVVTIISIGRRGRCQERKEQTSYA
uniref:Uncharacterized protein n=1 Tax=Micrurus lemniscatus lemniscatus TaxID=129467 RepID=A0A2D4HFT0_MICLE